MIGNNYNLERQVRDMITARQAQAAQLRLARAAQRLPHATGVRTLFRAGRLALTWTGR